MISVIVPCYNEFSRGVGSCSLSSRLKRIKSDVDYMGIDIELIFVDDGSSDDTFTEIFNFIYFGNISNWSVVHHKTNKGKGSAIKTGITKAKGDYIAYVDADLSTPLSYLSGVADSLSPDLCFIASRYLNESNITNKRPFARRVVSKISRLVLSWLFSLSVSDTQCGFKVFPADILKRSVNILKSERWLLDIELLYIMKVNNIGVVEFPVVWNNMEGESTLRLSSGMICSFIELVSIFLRKGRIRRYFLG